MDRIRGGCATLCLPVAHPPISHDMVTHMKTTVEIPDPILDAARATAHREGTTLRNLVVEGLRLALDRRQQDERFRLREASVGGRGLRPELQGAPWEEIRGRAYEGRGS